MISARKAKHLDATTMFTYSHANTPLGQSERAHYLSYFINYYRSLLITIHHYTSLPIITHNYRSLPITTHHCPSLHITVHHYTSLSITTITVHHYTSLSITAHYYPSLHITKRDFYRFAAIQPRLTSVCLCFCQKVPRFSLAIML